MQINEIFYSIQGEGAWTGTPAVFIRFSGCNLKCSFCDTKHEKFEDLDEDNIISQIEKYPSKYIVLTGGEPTLQLTLSFLQKLNRLGKHIQIETNGSVEIPNEFYGYIDWITCSPKIAKVVLNRIDELKVVYQYQDMAQYQPLVEKANQLYLQPCDLYDKEKNNKNILACINFIKTKPQWKLSLQTQKILNVR